MQSQAPIYDRVALFGLGLIGSLLGRAIRWGDGDALHALFTRTRDIRQGVIDAGQDH